MPSTFLPAPEILDSPRGRRFTDAAPQALTIPGTPLPAEAPVVIIGGGLAALTLAAQLWHHDIRDYLILEREPKLTGRFFTRVDNVSQRVLRSPYEHHPGAEGHRDCEMLDFARLHWSWLTEVEQHEVRMAQSGQRGVAPIDLFESYCSHVAASHDVTKRARSAAVREVVRAGDRWQVVTDRGSVRASAVVWAVGEPRRPAPDTWDTHSPRVRFWDEPQDRNIDSRNATHAVIGSGLSSAHIVHDLCTRGHRVRWIFRGKEHYQCADVNAAFFRPEGRAMFSQRSLEHRARMLTAERRPSIMFEFRPRLQAWEESGQLSVLRETEVSALKDCGAHVEIAIADGDTVQADRVHLALGTQMHFSPGVRGAQIRIHRGLPLVSDSTMELAGAPGLYAIGALASCALGPAARNIDGHRVAAARITAALQSALPKPDNPVDQTPSEAST
ncbi:NAD(P)-binding domain-containing protein [Streptomyces sp. NBRC 110028]|uniref:NAD(P)-binding domain-containing protein n=1 Tax=Streptomyces sp. NBRC 110028 TaxID=1621260 RepID=UPI0007C6B69E|nr:NAD(P)-binding domain-containing protein [Streptomyces sp. NBRC 110028]